MKKIFCLISLLMAFNVHAAELDLAAVFSGRTNDSVCYLITESGVTKNSVAIACGSKAAQGGIFPVKKLTMQVISDFVETGKWNLVATFVGANNQTHFVFTKK